MRQPLFLYGCSEELLFCFIFHPYRVIILYVFGLVGLVGLILYYLTETADD